MIALLMVLLLPLHFTAPADTLGVDAAGNARLGPVHAYIFHQLAVDGTQTTIHGYADPDGTAILVPHSPGTRETVWLEPAMSEDPVTIFVRSVDASGNVSVASNGCVIGRQGVPDALATRGAAGTALNVPLVAQARERCGQAALAMVLRFYGAAPAALREVDAVYDSVLHGSRMVDLMGAARRAGFEADVATLTPDSLIDLLNEGVPPILLYESGSRPVTYLHFGVLTGWDAVDASFTLNDGTAQRYVASRDDMVKRWETAGSQALIVRERLR